MMRVCHLIFLLCLHIGFSIYFVVEWNNYRSWSFAMKSGVRQGNVISIWMFHVYVYDLVNAMEASENECMMQGKFVVVSYTQMIFY